MLHARLLPSRFYFAAALLAGATALIGCTGYSLKGIENLEEPPKAKGAASPRHVQVDGSALQLMDGQIATSKAADLLPAADRLLKENRFASLRLVTSRRIDGALETLRDSLSEDQASAALIGVGQSYDKVVGITASDGWQAVNADRSQRAEPYRSYAVLREKVRNTVRIGRPDQDSMKRLLQEAKAAPGMMVQLDAARLVGIAWMIEKQPKKGAAVLADGVKLASRVDLYQAVQLQLLLSDALRRAEQIEDADACWEECVVAAAALAKRETAIVDPVFWDHASYLRPVSCPWPRAVREALLPRSPLPRDLADVTQQADGDELRSNQPEEETEAIVWGAIGQALLARDNAQEGILALKRAESSSRHESTKQWMRLAEAVALARLDQSPAATAILLSLASDESAIVSKAASATLAGLRLQKGDSTVGFRLFDKALNQGEVPQWSGLADAEADLGLLYLMRKEEENGLRWLRRAQVAYQRDGDVLGLNKCFRNEAEYYKFNNKKVEASEIETKIVSLEADETRTARR